MSDRQEQYVSGDGVVEDSHIMKGHKADHDEILLRLKSGKLVRIRHNRKLGKPIEVVSGDSVSFHGYSIPGTNVIHRTHRNGFGFDGGLENYGRLHD